MKFDPTPVIQPHLIWQFFFAPLVTVLTGFFLKTDTMVKLDQSKLVEVFEKKHGTFSELRHGRLRGFHSTGADSCLSHSSHGLSWPCAAEGSSVRRQLEVPLGCYVHIHKHVYIYIYIIIKHNNMIIAWYIFDNLQWNIHGVVILLDISIYWWNITRWLCQNRYWRWPLLVDFPVKKKGYCCCAQVGCCVVFWISQMLPMLVYQGVSVGLSLDELSIPIIATGLK